MKTGRAFVLVSACTAAMCSTAPAQPVDLCTSAPELGVGSWPFDTNGASPEGFAFSGCVNGGSPPAASPGATTPDVWFKHTMTIDGGYLSVEACSSPAPALAAYLDASGCGSPSLACNVRAAGESFVCDNNTKIRSRVVVGPAAIGTTILVRVSSATTNGTTTGVLTVGELAPAANDARANAQLIDEISGSVAFDTKLATYDANDFSTAGYCATAGQGATAADVWFEFVPTASGLAAVVITDPSPGTTANFNALASVFSGTDLSALACARSNVGGTLGSSKASRIVFPVIAGQSYFIRAAGSVAGVGALRVFAPQPALANDDCAGAMSVNGNGATSDGSVGIDTSVATITPGNITGCSPGFASTDASFDLWYSYTPPAGTPANSFVIFSTCGSPMVCKVVAVATCSATTQMTPGCSTSACLNETGSLSQTGWSRVGPVTAGTTILVRVAGVSGNTGQATLSARLESPPANDVCDASASGNVLVEDMPMPYSTMAATQDRTSSCSNSTLIPDVWFRYVPAASGLATFHVCSAVQREANQSTITVVPDCAAAEILSCRSVLHDSCFPTLVSSAGSRGVLRMRVTAGESLLLRVASSSTDAALRHSRGLIEVSVRALTASEHYEGNSETVGQTTATALPVPIAGSISALHGNINGGGDRADVYRIRICNPAAFSATTDNVDRFTQEVLNFNLFLFDENGFGIDYQSTVGLPATLGNGLVPAPGVYYLAISTPRTGAAAPMPTDASNAALWMMNPGAPVQPPNGPGSTNPFTGWSGTSTVLLHTPYTISLTGASGICGADFNANCTLEVQDIFDFLNAWFAGNPSADFNGGGLSIQDIFDFLNAWFAGC